MVKSFQFNNPEIYKKIKVLSNPARFKILEILQEKEMSVTQIGKVIKINYRRCSEYIRKMEKLNLINKRKDGRDVYVKSKISIHKLVSSFN